MPQNDSEPLGTARVRGVKILLVTTCWWPAFGRFAQLLIAAGCDIAVLCPTGHPARMVQGITVFEHRAFSPLLALSQAICRFDPVFIVPGDERTSRHLHRLHASGSERERTLVERSLGAPESYPCTISRVKILALARHLGVLVPMGRAVAGKAELAAWLSAAPAPWVLKLDGSWGGMGVVVAATERAAFAAFRRLRSQSNAVRALFRMVVNRDAYWLADWLRSDPAAISVQSFIAGRPGDLAMFCWEGEVLAAVMGEAVSALGENRPTAVVRLITRPDVLEAAARLARSMGLTGFYGLDFMIEAATNRALLLEMNPRPTSMTNIRLERGGDLLGALVIALCGTPLLAPVRLPDRALVAYFPLAWQDSHPDDLYPDAHHDIPMSEPALMAEMLQPRWPERQILARFGQAYRQVAGRMGVRLRAWIAEL